MNEVSQLPDPPNGQDAQITAPEGALGLTPSALVEVSALALRAHRANGPVIKLMNRLGRSIEDRMGALPPKVQQVVEFGTAELLERAYRAAGAVSAHPSVPDSGDWGHRAAAVAGGALGGFGGLGTALVELPATVALFFAAMQKAAAEQGFDPTAEETRLTCLELFGAGGPMRHDDGVNSGFFSVRLAVNGATVQTLVQQIAPVFAGVLGRKLASQAVPVFGAAAGAGINLAFMSYYQDMAHVRFGLKRLADTHGEAEVLAQFRQRVLALR
jgi:hypothetical protein